MDFLMREVGLEAELQLGPSGPISSKDTGSDSLAPPVTEHKIVQIPEANVPLQSAISPAAASVSGLEAASKADKASLQKGDFRKSSSWLRLPALGQESTNTPRISARHPSKNAYSVPSRTSVEASDAAPVTGSYDAGNTASARTSFEASKSAPARALLEAGTTAPAKTSFEAGQQLPRGFVSSGDLEEDAQRLIDMESEVCHTIILLYSGSKLGAHCGMRKANTHLSTHHIHLACFT